MFAQHSLSSLRLDSYKKIQENSFPLDSVKFRNIGPSVMSGRITDIEVNPTNSTEFFVAYASGGVFYSNNNGQTFEPIFDREATLTIGDMAMDWKNNILWVGTGEVNSSRSSYAGTGIYKSENRGKSWQHLGLEESHHVGKIILHPSNKQIAWCGVLGHLYSKNKERGIYKTEDGGKSWKQVLYINDSTGVVDIQMINEKKLVASAWSRTRSAWNFNGAGGETGLYFSEDGGETWMRNKSGSGFPEGKGVGRIGISVCASKPNIMYALVDNQFNQEKKATNEEQKKLNARDFLTMSEEDFNKISDKDLNAYLKENNYPEKYTTKNIKEQIEQKKYKIADIGNWKLADADANLFNTPIYGAQVYRSDDEGVTWKITNKEILEGVYFTYGYYFGAIQVSPSNADEVWIGGYPILRSIDGGKTFEQKDGENCHPDYHRIWINPKQNNHVIAANDGGLNISYDSGENWFKANSPAVGQFYAIDVDNEKPYNVYGGLQDNGTWYGSSKNIENESWHQSGQYGYKEVGGGDGMQIRIDTRDNNTIYLGYQFGNYWRSKKNGNDYLEIKPTHEIGEAALRFNWQTPILLSKHNQDIFYYGSNCFHRSMNKGGDLKKLSSDLSSPRAQGNVPYGTLTTIAECPLKFGLLYAGTDDGLLWKSEDVGYTWKKISNMFPPYFWVSRVVASKHNENRIYASLNGYRKDDFNPYLFISENKGDNWKRIGTDIPAEPINVVKEDPKNENIIYVGTDNGLYVSFDKGIHFIPWRGNLPRVAIHDIAIQERENEIVLGTHGRSIYIAKLDLVQDWEKVKNENLKILPIDEIIFNGSLGKKWASYANANSSSVAINFISKTKEKVKVEIFNSKNKVLKTIYVDAIAGINTLNYDFSIDEKNKNNITEKITKMDDGNFYLPVGTYKIKIENKASIKSEVNLIIKEK